MLGSTLIYHSVTALAITYSVNAEYASRDTRKNFPPDCRRVHFSGALTKRFQPRVNPCVSL